MNSYETNGVIPNYFNCNNKIPLDIWWLSKFQFSADRSVTSQFQKVICMGSFFFIISLTCPRHEDNAFALAQSPSGDLFWTIQYLPTPIDKYSGIEPNDIFR